MRVWPSHTRGTWISTARSTMGQVEGLNLSLIAAGVAFFTLLSLFPTLSALVSVWGLFADPAALEAQLSLLSGFVPDTGFQIIEGRIANLVSAPNAALNWTGALSLLLALWSAKNGVSALTRGLNAAYREPNRGGVRHVAYMLLLTIVLLLTTVLALALLIGVPLVLSFLPIGLAAEIAARLGQWIMLALSLLLLLSLIYRFAPNRRGARFAFLSPGALVATGLWLVGSAALTLYFERFGAYNEVYGSLGAIIALLFWFFLSAFVVLLGGVINAELERHTKRDSTIGPPKPLGERGAQVADTYVSAD